MNGMELKELLDVTVAKAVKEFAEKLKSEMGEHYDTDNPRIYEIIDELLKQYGVEVEE